MKTRSESFVKRGKYVKETYEKQKEQALKRSDAQFNRLKKRYGAGLDKLIVRWQDQKVVTLREKIAFVVGVSNIFISGYLMGGYPYVYMLPKPIIPLHTHLLL